MRINWKRFSSGALLLACFSLLLYGCSDFGSTQSAQSAAAKSISGIVSDPGTGLPLANAKVTAYAIDASGTESAAPLSEYPTSVTSDQGGAYTLQIPASYNGAVMVEAQLSSSNVLKRVAQQLLGTTLTTIKSALPQTLVALPSIPPVMVSFATDALVKFVGQNYAGSGGLSTGNIRKAEAALENVFGANFTQLPPPAGATDTSTSKAQQDLLVSISAFNSVIAANGNTSVDSLMQALGQTGLSGTLADALKSALQTAANTLLAGGSLPPQYAVNPAINAAISNAQNGPLAVTLELSDITPPTAPGNLAAQAMAPRRVDLSWSASSDETALGGYLIYRQAGSTGVYLAIDMVGADAVSYSDLAAAPQSRYSYRVVAFDRAHNLSVASNVSQATTPAPLDAIAPAAPSGLNANVSGGKVLLSWQASLKTAADGTLVPASRYYVFRDYQLIGSTTDISYSDGGVQSGDAYLYYVKAADGQANLSAASLPAVVRLPAASGASLPSAPTALTLVSTAASRVAFVWTDSQAGVTYDVYRDGAPIATGVAAKAYADSSVLPGSTCSYTVTAVTATAESAPSAGLSVSTPSTASASSLQPSVPTGVVAASMTANSVSLLWTPSTMPDGSAVAGYEVFRDGGKIAAVRLPGFIDTGAAPATTYSYQVKAFSAAGIRSDASAALPVVTPAAATDSNPPSTPVLQAPAYDGNAGAVKLGWSASLKGDGTPAAGYVIYRDGAPIAAGASALFTVQSGVSYSFTDSTVAPGTGYSYAVKGVDSAGILSAASNAGTITVPAPPSGYRVTGRVMINGVGLSGVTLTLLSSDGTSTRAVTSDANGYYSMVGVTVGVSYTLTPSIVGSASTGTSSSTGYYFAPSGRSIVSSTDLTGQDFALKVAGAVIGGVAYPDGTIIGGITYPTGITVINGVSYPTGTVIGGISYPSGVLIGGVSYPAGTVVGGIAFPVGYVVAGLGYPTGVVVGSTIYPVGTGVSGSLSYPSGVLVGSAVYPVGSVEGGVIFPITSLSGTLGYPTGSVSGTLNWGP